MVKQPIDVCGQLHIALNTHRRFLAGHEGLNEAARRGFGDPQHQIPCTRGVQFRWRQHIEQTSWRDADRKRPLVPLHHHATAFLARQAVHGFGLLHQHMVHQQQQAPLHLERGPCGRLKLSGDRKKYVVYKRHRGLDVHSPRLFMQFAYCSA